MGTTTMMLAWCALALIAWRAHGALTQTVRRWPRAGPQATERNDKMRRQVPFAPAAAGAAVALYAALDLAGVFAGTGPPCALLECAPRHEGIERALRVGTWVILAFATTGCLGAWGLAWVNPGTAEDEP